MGPKVSIVRTRRNDNLEDIEKALDSSLSLIGGLKGQISKSYRVLLKPNILTEADYRTGATTNPFLIEALIRYLRRFSCHITMAEGAVVGKDTRKAFKACGIDRLAKDYDIELVDLKRDIFVKKDIPGGIQLKELAIPKTVIESDYIINIAVAKTHDSFPATLALKNIKGVIAEEDKKKFHNLDLKQCIVDLNKVVKTDLAIIDGSIGMEGLGPIYGDPVGLNLIISSFDVVLADIVASRVMGLDPLSIGYIKLALEQGLTGYSESDIELSGQKIEDVKKKFKVIDLNSSSYKRHLIKVFDEKACSGCMHTLESFLYKTDRRGDIEKLAGHTFILGKGNDPKDIEGDRIVRFGRCAKEIDIMGSYYVHGCPPHMDTIRKVLDIKKEE